MNPQDQVYIDSVQEQINSGLYENLFGDRRGLVFLDIGANIGAVSIYAVPYCKRIVAIEPSPETYAQLIENTRHYSIIEHSQVALANENKFVPFYVNDINFTASSTVNTYGKQIMVEGAKLSTILTVNKLYHVDVCKIDAEGAEGEALSYDQIQQAHKIIDCWFVEFHNCPRTTWEHKIGTSVGNFARCGYMNMEVKGMSLTVRR